MTPALVKVTDPPRDTAPPPDIPVPAVTVTLELAKSVLVTDPSTIEAELTEAVVIRPVEESTRKVAEAVDIPPTKTSSVILVGATAPAFLCQLPTLEVSVQVGTPPATAKTWPVVPIVLLARVFVPDA